MSSVLDAISPEAAVDTVKNVTSTFVPTLTTFGRSLNNRTMDVVNINSTAVPTETTRSQSSSLKNPMVDAVMNGTSFITAMTSPAQSPTALHYPTSSKKRKERLTHSITTVPIARPTTDRIIKSTTLPTSLDQVHKKKEKEFSFDFLDTKEFQDRVAVILAARDPAQMSTMGNNIGTTVAYFNDTSNLAANLGLLIPVAIFALFLLFVGVCVLRHGLHKSMHTKKQKKSTLSNFYRSQSGWESTRASTKSTTALQFEAKVSNVSQREFVPRLDRISESPEDRFLGSSRCGSSLESLMSQLQHDLAAMVASNRSLGISPYELMQPPNYFSDPSQSYPNIPVSAQASFSPYHLAWITPSINSLGPISMNNQDMGNNETTAVNGTQGNNKFRPMRKSPFHPNNNTPTNGEKETEAHLSNVFVNQVSSISLLPEVSHESMKDFISASEPEHINSNKHMTITPLLAKLNRSSSADAVSAATPSSDCILSGKSNLGSWRYNNLYVQPPPGVQPPGHHLFPISSAEKCAFDMAKLAHTSSPNAMVGSKNTPVIQPNAELITGSASLPDLPNRVSHGGYPLYQADLARYLHYEFSRCNPMPPYEGCPSHMAPQLSSQTSNASSCNASSTNNASTCAHIDSLETRTTSSTATGQTSRNTSGYTAGASHSTSVAGLPTEENVLGIPLRNSSLMSTSISSIMPVPGGARHTPSDTSFSDSSSFTKSIKKGIHNHHLPMPKMSTANTSLENGNVKSDSLTVSPTATKSSLSTGPITMTSMPYDEASGKHTSTTSHATLSSAIEDQSQHTTAPESISLQWDSLSVETTSMEAASVEAASVGITTPGSTSMTANQGSHDNSANSNSVPVEKSSWPKKHGHSIMVSQRSRNSSANSSTGSMHGKKSSSINTTTSQPSTSDKPLIGFRRGGLRATQMSFQWDTYPFYNTNMSGPRRKSPIRMEPGNTGPPPKRLTSRQRGPDAPGLVTQYWV